MVVINHGTIWLLVGISNSKSLKRKAKQILKLLNQFCSSKMAQKINKLVSYGCVVQFWLELNIGNGILRYSRNVIFLKPERRLKLKRMVGTQS